MALEYGVVAGRYRSTIADTPDDADDLPQLEPLVGTIIFDPRPEVILVDGTAAEGSMTITPMPTRVQLGANGDLSHNGKPYVKLLSPESSSIDTHDWTYEVSFDLRTLDGQPVRMNSFDIFVKASDTVARPLDLTTATPVIRNTGTQTIIGPSNVLKIGKVVSGAAAQAIITGTSPEQTLDLVLPTGATGATPRISVGTVETVANPADAEWIAQLIRTGGLVMTEALRAAFPSTMKGDKGDPGGWNMGTIIPVAADLNTFTTPGIYVQPNSIAPTTPGLNYPPMVAISGSTRGVLTVTTWNGASNTAMQEYTNIGTGANSATDVQRPGVSYRRHYYNGFWSAWSATTSQRVDNTAGRAIYTWDDANNREQLIYGDTGMRNISADLMGMAAPAGNSYSSIRREGNTVTICINGAVIAASVSGSLEFYRIPAGFRHSFQQINMYAITRTSPMTAKSMQLVSTQYLRLYQDPQEGEQIRHIITYQTPDPWPTALPGVAA